MNTYIEFKKQRELGDIISDTFGFIRSEFKPFFKTVLQISGPYLVFFLLSLAFYLYSIGSIFNFNNPNLSTFSPFLTVLAVLLLVISALLAYTVATSVVLHYIKSYIANKGMVDVEEIRQNTKSTFFGILGLNVVKWFVLLLSAMLCLLPILYFMVPMYIVLCIFIYEDKDVSDSFSHSFNLIKQEFWITFFTIILIGIIIAIAGFAFGLPATIYSYIKMGIFSGEVDPANTFSSLYDPVLIILNLFSYFIQFLLNLISVVGSAFIYFNLNERKNFTGTYERIQSIGQ